MKKSVWIVIGVLAAAAVITALLGSGNSPATQDVFGVFDGQRAFKDLVTQVDFGPRTPGSAAHDQAVQYIQDVLKNAGWTVELQHLEFEGHSIENIIAKRGGGSPFIILGAHYDTRLSANRDPDASKQNQPVPGANDGASGAAVLLELSRILPTNLNGQIWLVFFDAEDQGNLPGWNWILGSRAFVDQLDATPDAVVIADMVGDASLTIYREKNSDPALTREIWDTAEKLGYAQYFIPEDKYSLLDDHTPFIERGIAAVEIIDFEYPYWHTTEDTVDKTSAESLKIVGDTLREWIALWMSVGKK